MADELKAQLDRIEILLMTLVDALAGEDEGEGGDEFGADRDQMGML